MHAEGSKAMDLPEYWPIDEDQAEWDPALTTLLSIATASDRGLSWDYLDRLFQSRGLDAIATLLGAQQRAEAREWELEDAILAMEFDD